MMYLLHYVIADQSASTSLPAFPAHLGNPPRIPPGFRNGLCSVLYSDVGTFYEACDPGTVDSLKAGWRRKSAAVTIWALANLPNIVSPRHATGLQLVLLTGTQLGKVWDRDAELMAGEFASRSVAAKPNTAASFTFLPTAGVAAIQYQRWKAYIPTVLPQLSNKYDDLPWGAVLQPSPVLSSTNPPLNYISWTLDAERTGPKTLMITRFRFDSVGSFMELLDSARRIALEWGLEQIEAWNFTGVPNQGTSVDIDSKWNGVDGTREDHLPYVAWYGQDDSSDVRFEWNEK